MVGTAFFVKISEANDKFRQAKCTSTSKRNHIDVFY
ncbi:hypothetical protein L1283_004663 [Sphingobacterium sp. HSC-15S19]